MAKVCASITLIVLGMYSMMIIGCAEHEEPDIQLREGRIEQGEQRIESSSAGSSQSNGGTRVFICLGDNAKSYHTDRGCDALNNCQAEIIEIDRSETASRDRDDPCNRCVAQ